MRKSFSRWFVTATSALRNVSSLERAASTPSALTMNSFGVRAAKISYPSGDPNFSVLQAFPSAFSAEEADPFLMCDDFGPIRSTGKITHADEFPLGWHPHRGQDLLTYMTRGVGRHGDSMGNREEFNAPSMQWICAGSGIEHAEGGGTPAGEFMQGFQIWINVPSELKMRRPAYGTNPEDQIPVLSFDKDGDNLGTARLLAGASMGKVGPFKTVANVQILDVVLPSDGAEVVHEIPEGLENVLVYVYDGEAVIGGEHVPAKHVARFEPKNAKKGGKLTLQAAPGAPAVSEDVGFGTGHAVKMLIFAGKKLRQPIAWHGPFVMTTQDEIRETISEYRRGTFLKHRFPGNYKRKADIDRVLQERATKAESAEAGKAPQKADQANVDNETLTQCGIDGPTSAK